MTNDELRSEQDPEKLRSAALGIHRRNLQLEAENAILLKRIATLVADLAKATDRNRQVSLNLEIRRLNEQLAEKNRELFGPSKSERRSESEAKAEATPESEATAAPESESKTEAKSEKPKRPGHGPTPQTRLPILEVTHTRPATDTTCPSCREPQPVMVGQTEDTEQITIIERKVVLCVHKRQKYRCILCGRIDAATGAPEPLLPGGRYTPEFAVAVAVDKYSDHLPLERQVQRFDRLGLEITRQTLWDQLVALYHLLLPAYLEIRTYLLAKPVLGADESPWRVMGKGRSARWWTWVLVAEDAVFYKLAPGRGKAAARELLEGFGGVLSVDGYPVYTSLEAEFGKQASLFAGEGSAEACAFLLVCCWMHARRGFFQAESAGHAEAQTALDLIAQLYAIEAKAETLATTTSEPLLELRRRLRDTESRAVVAELRTWIDAQKPIPSLKLEKALTYIKNQWPRLIRFLDDPRAPIDNGWAERAVRGTVLGRKNHYGSHSELGTRVAALFYTLTETCKLLEIDPAAYLLAAALRAKADRDDVWTPMRWKAELLAKGAAARA